MRLRAALLALLLAACGGGDDGAESTADTVDLLDLAAVDYAVTARRALESTRFAPLGDRWLADRVLAVCRGLSAGSPAGELIAAELAAVPEGPAADDEILAVVLTEGVAQVCPEQDSGEPAASPADEFVAVTVTAAQRGGFADLDASRLLETGDLVCRTLDGSANPEDAVLAELAFMFGVEGDSVAEISASGALGEAEGIMAGTVLGAAAAYLCPRHLDSVAAYITLLGT